MSMEAVLWGECTKLLGDICWLLVCSTWINFPELSTSKLSKRSNPHFRLEKLCPPDGSKVRLKLTDSVASFHLNSSLLPGTSFTCHVELILDSSKSGKWRKLCPIFLIISFRVLCLLWLNEDFSSNWWWVVNSVNSWRSLWCRRLWDWLRSVRSGYPLHHLPQKQQVSRCSIQPTDRPGTAGL